MGDSHSIDGHKLDLHLDRVCEWKFKGDTAPVYVEISPTSRCNHRCSFCALDYINTLPEKSTISDSMLKKIGTELSGLGVRGVMFGGEGEPTLHHSLPEIIGHYHDLEIDCGLTTNGTGLDEWFAVEGGEFLKWVKVSINAGDFVTYSRVHNVGGTEYDRIWNNIIEFKKACSNNHPTIGVQAVAISDNVLSLPSLCRSAAIHELDYIVIKPYNPNSLSLNNKKGCFVIPQEIVNDCLQYANKKTEVIVRNRSVNSLSSDFSYPKCSAVPYFWFYINSKAEVIACPNHMTDNRFNLGNMNNQTIKDIWYSYTTNKREELKQIMRSFDVSHCRKACRMDAINEWLWKINRNDNHKSFI